MFAIAFALYAVCFRKTFNLVAEILEEIVSHLRIRIADKIRHAELASLETVDQAEIYNLLTSEARVISESGGVLAAALQSAVLLAFASLYLAYLSVPALLFCVVLIGATLPRYMRRLREVGVWMLRTSQQEVQAFNTIRDLLDGFKEVKLHEERSRALMADIAQTAGELRVMKVTTADMFNVNYLMAYGAFYVMMAAVMFILPGFVSIAHGDMVRVMMTVLFIVGPLGAVVQGVQSLSKANAAVQRMTQLERRLDRFTEIRDERAPAVSVARAFREIRLEAVSFEYVDRDGNPLFRVGPLELAVGRGEILFVMGGNGSGKTTLLKLLMGLYPPATGRLSIDDVPVGEAERSSYRSLFSAIFADFHLFRKLYGLPAIRPEAVHALLRQFQLEAKTDFETDHFTNVRLSTGQRKRLAMIVALLEDRPCYVFDEWAADQDPEFRRYFYEELLRDLAARGKTIVAVTHDDRYLHVADRVITMELGQIERRRERNGGPGAGSEGGR
jgi:putative ATP-binding cassette transporter